MNGDTYLDQVTAANRHPGLDAGAARGEVTAQDVAEHAAAMGAYHRRAWQDRVPVAVREGDDVPF